ncbi:TPA: prepilin-type N-terminal cleavage/methylation domain-containing protein, partial [Klebsiella pneumoniae]
MKREAGMTLIEVMVA